MHGLITSSIVAALLSGSAAVWVGRFAKTGTPPTPWHVVKYSNARPTTYRVATVEGKMAVEAIVDSSMSLLARPIKVDLAASPVLCWSVDAPVQKADMTRKSGDDYAARIYVAFDMPDSAIPGSAKLKLSMARAILGKNVPDAAVVYVWDNSHAVGTMRRSSYTDRSKLIVAESGASRSRQWVSERADLASDFGKAFSNQPGTPTQIAIAADGDNTKSKGRAAFTNIHFVPRGQPCVV